MDEDEDSFAKRCPDLFAKSGMKIAELADKAGLEYHAVRNYVLGKSRPRPKQRQQLAQALGTTVDYLFGLSDDPTLALIPSAPAFPAAPAKELFDTSEVVPSPVNLQRQVAKQIEGIALQASDGRLAVRDTWLEGGLWPVQADVGIFSKDGCIAVLHTASYKGDFADLGPIKDVAALRMNLLARHKANRALTDCGIILSLVVDGTALTPEQLVEQLRFFVGQLESLVAHKIIIAGVLTLTSNSHGRSPTVYNPFTIERLVPVLKEYIAATLAVGLA